MAIRFNNNREFFQANRDWYLRAVRAPSLQLVETLSPLMRKIDANFELRPYRVLSHINRDVRFARDKSPYRDHLWLSFHRSGESRGSSFGFYFELSDEGASMGMGAYQDRTVMKPLRRAMETDTRRLMKAARPALDNFQLVLESAARPRVPESVAEQLRPWYAAKYFYFERDIADFDLIRSPQLADAIAEGYVRLKPLYQYIRALPME